MHIEIVYLYGIPVTNVSGRAEHVSPDYTYRFEATAMRMFNPRV